MIIRTIRDIVSPDIDAIYIDKPEAYERAQEFLKLVMPKFVSKLTPYNDNQPLFHKYGVEEEILKINSREVPLENGGSIVIDQTEALVAIDVNSGSFRIEESAEDTAYQLNMAAAKEISRQLRLRDLGGVIVNDFIDMRREKHRRNLEKSLRDHMKRDRARTKILRTSPFGLIEMTRQRIRPSLKRSLYNECPCCKGRSVVKTAESMAIEVIRTLRNATETNRCEKITVRVNENVSAYLNNKKRRELAELEDNNGILIQILGSEGLFPEHLEIDCRDKNGNPITVK